MKTNYTNPKQKLFAITLTIATIVSLAWINPAKKERQAKIIAAHKIAVTPISALSPLDTGKKKAVKAKKTKVVRITAANSIIAPTPPPAIMMNSSIPSVPPIPNIPEAPEAPEMLTINIDDVITPAISSAMSNYSIHVQSMLAANINGKNKDEIKKMQIDLQKQGLSLQKRLNTPEQRAKLQKYAAQMQAKYNSPAERAKWEKLAAEAQSHAMSAEQQKEINKQLKEAQMKLNSPEFKIRLKEIVSNQNMLNLITVENGEDQKIKQSPEYIELKKKFDKDVEDLANKKLKKE